MIAMKRLEQLLSAASSEIPYYSSVVIRDEIANRLKIDAYPCLQRETVQRCTDLLCDRRYSRESNHYFEVETSGSSGAPIVVRWERDQYLASMRGLWNRRKLYYNITPRSKMVNFTLNTNNCVSDLEYTFDKTNTILSVNRPSLNTEGAMDKLCAVIAAFQPEWFYVQPRVLSLLIEHMAKKHIDPPRSLRYVESVGELLFNDIRNRTIDVLRAPVANMYGSEEMNGIALECPYGRFHVLSENVFAECLEKNVCETTGTGQIILTNLHNRTMPFIRYNQGDVVRLSAPAPCTCGFTDAAIDIILGRVQERVVIGQETLDSYVLNEAVRYVTKFLGNCVSKYKFCFAPESNTLHCFFALQSNSLIQNDEFELLFSTGLRQNNAPNVSLLFQFGDAHFVDAYTTKHKVFTVLDPS